MTTVYISSLRLQAVLLLTRLSSHRKAILALNAVFKQPVQKGPLKGTSWGCAACRDKEFSPVNTKPRGLQGTDSGCSVTSQGAQIQSSLAPLSLAQTSRPILALVCQLYLLQGTVVMGCSESIPGRHAVRASQAVTQFQLHNNNSNNRCYLVSINSVSGSLPNILHPGPHIIPTIILGNGAYRPNLQGFPDGSEGKESAYNAGDQGLIPRQRRSLPPASQEGNGCPNLPVRKLRLKS